MPNDKVFFDIAEDAAKLASSKLDKQRAFDAAQVSINSYLVGTAISGMRSLKAINDAIEDLVAKVFNQAVISEMEPKEAIRLLDRALELFKTQVDVARQVSKETDWDKLAGLITEMQLYEEASEKGLNDDLIKAIAEELAARIDPDKLAADAVKKKGVKKVKRVKRQGGTRSGKKTAKKAN